MNDSSMPAIGKHALLKSALITLLILALYAPSLRHGFVWDDHVIIANPALEQLANIPHFFLMEDTAGESTGYYRPVTYICFALEKALWGANPLGYHLTNLVLHVLVSLLLYALLQELFKNERLGFWTALLFALHPVAGETVNFLSGGRNTLLCACFALLAFLLYLKGRYLLSAAAFTAAIFSKEFALLMPVLFLLYDCRIGQTRLSFRHYALYALPVLVYLTLRSFAVQKANFLTEINLSDLSLSSYLVVKYAVNVIMPVQLKVLYEVQPTQIVRMGCLILVALALMMLYRLRDRQETFFSLCWFFLFLLPVINIIPLRITTIMADRYAYFSLMGGTLLLATLLCSIKKHAAMTGLAAICACYAGIGFSRTDAWADDIAFFTRMTKDAPRRFDGYKNLGMAYYQRNDLSRAASNLEQANSAVDITIPYIMGNAYIFWKENLLDKAEHALQRVVQMDPYYPEPYLMLMLIQEQRGNREQAQRYRIKLESMGHDIGSMLEARVVELCQTGEKHLVKRQYPEAKVYFWQALQIKSGYVPVLLDMGNLSAEQGNFDDAHRYFARVLELDPTHVTVHYNLAMLYQMQGRTDEAQAEMARYRQAEMGSLSRREGASGAPPARR